MFLRVSAVVAAGALLATVTVPSHANGLDKLHKQAREGGRTCMIGHYHFGSSGPWSSKAQAMAVAKRSWERFTAGEYGPAWGSLRLAGSVGYACGSSKSARGTLWSCELKARPCRKL
ncbi:MAG: hypothetical protein AB7E80_01485 [Hyphomicrobiaceae bacterium]